MTNRDKYFTKHNPYDLLITIHKNTTECAIMLVTGCANPPCPKDSEETCEQCLQKWFNSHAEKGLDFIK